ncbi:hypothetical protein [Brucella gallinifaecis]|uniref:hypothetical protein n=1 Tax=Brucella gallinifaecis TaxID=215590 RepID=UPI0023617978|nr:hypothetical protein [Brucella gallinifaecis]
MSVALNSDDRSALALADQSAIIDALSRFRNEVCPPWLPTANPHQDGVPPKGEASFAAISDRDLIEIIAVRGPLHVIDGWSYLGRAFSSILSGQTHAARHMAYYAELRAALSILASSGIGVFNRRNAVIDASGSKHIMSPHATHDMAWLALVEWSLNPSSLERLIRPLKLAGSSLLDPFQDFFPSQASTVAGELMTEWGFDLQQGVVDRDQRNWSSYQPTALGPLLTTPAEDTAFLKMFWNACRPNGVELERHLLRILLEKEARVHGSELYEYPEIHAQLEENTKSAISFDFLKRVTEPVDHDFLVHLAKRSTPSSAYSMMCRAGLLLKLATGMAEDNLRAAGVQPVDQFNNWWQEFGANHGLWRLGMPPTNTADLWEDIDLALEEIETAPTSHRYEWISKLAVNAVRVCETERVALWGLFQ